MISVICYGRNDGHGYNLAKRAALSFNCIAETLDDPDDEILFVDCNSEDEYASFPESIADTLTPKARKLLRVFRVRRSLYEARRSGSPLPLLESFSRNVALRRANPKNRWMLSTNPDMIFLIKNGNSFRRLLAKLPDGYYATPRYELPESLWEMLPRNEPRAVLKEIEGEAWPLGLHVAVRSEPWNGYDAPGDFQLLPLRHAIEIGGFHERMIRGWHVDSNFAKRCSLFYGRGAHSLDQNVFAYHMMHLRVLSSGHTGKAIKQANSVEEFVTQVTTAAPGDQPKDWGAPDLSIEEISLAQPRSFFSKWARRMQKECGPQRVAIEFAEYSDTGGINANWFSDLRRISVFLVNAFDHLPSGLSAVLLSGNKPIRDLMRGYVKEKNWNITIQGFSPHGNRSSDAPPMPDAADIVIFDFTLHFTVKLPESTPMEIQPRIVFHRNLYAAFRDLHEKVRASGFQNNPRIYCLGATHTVVEEVLWAAPCSWDAIPYATGFKRGCFHPIDDADLRLDPAARQVSARLDHFWTEAREAALQLDPGLDHTAGPIQMGPAFNFRSLFFTNRLHLAKQIIIHKDAFLHFQPDEVQRLDEGFVPTFDNGVFISFCRRSDHLEARQEMLQRWNGVKQYYGFGNVLASAEQPVAVAG